MQTFRLTIGTASSICVDVSAEDAEDAVRIGEKIMAGDKAAIRRWVEPQGIFLTMEGGDDEFIDLECEPID